MHFPSSARLALAATLLLPTVLPAQEHVDVATIARITTEAMEHSQVMDIMSWLTDVHGPRLTNSPIAKAAGDWTIGALNQWGMQNVRYETWGPFGRGWVTKRFSANMITPHPFQIIAYPAAWSNGTQGTQSGEVARVALTTPEAIEAARGTLKGKWVMMDPVPTIQPYWQPLATRFTDDALAGMAAVEPPTLAQQAQQGGARMGGQRAGTQGPNMNQLRQQFLVDEGALGILTASTRDGGTLRSAATQSRAADAPAAVPNIIVSGEHYGRISRLLEKNIPVTLEINAEVEFTEQLESWNIIAEIPGTDPALKDEVVLIGAHFDSWHMGTGATDNGAGSATMLEAMRILKALDLKPRRTIMIGLWTGEEQGLIGSREFVAKHIATRDADGVTPKPMHAKFSAYFNVDNGGGKIRGVFQQSNPAVAPIFDAWMGPFKDGGMKTLTITNTGGTDHQSFDAVGLPGFQFIQDPIEYGTRTHHTNMDVYERIQPDDMMWNSAVLASFAWQAAQRDEKLPRKPMPAAPGARE